MSQTPFCLFFFTTIDISLQPSLQSNLANEARKFDSGIPYGYVFQVVTIPQICIQIAPRIIDNMPMLRPTKLGLTKPGHLYI